MTKKKKILILGKGFLGLRLKNALGCDISGRRIRSFKDAEREVDKYKPDVIINCIGHVGRNVDDCELDKDNTLLANTFVPIILAEVAIKKRIKLVQINTGCLYHYDYSKDKPIKEDKAPDFFDLIYSRSKIYSGRALCAASDRFDILILRPRIPLDDLPHAKNILTKLINSKSVIDIPNSITYVPDFIDAIKHLIKIDARGIYNIVNKGTLKYPHLMDIYKKYVPGFNYKVISYKEFNRIRTNLILSTTKLERSGFKVRDINSVLDGCVRSYLKAKNRGKIR